MSTENSTGLSWKNTFIAIFLIFIGIFFGWLIFSSSPTQSSFSFNELVSLNISVILGSVSIVLGVYAIWLTLHFKNESDQLNKKTDEYLQDIKINSKLITDYAFKELNKWGDVGRENLQNKANGEPSPIVQDKGTTESQVEPEHRKFQFHFDGNKAKDNE